MHTYRYSGTCICTIEVEAESEEEAFDKAMGAGSDEWAHGENDVDDLILMETDEEEASA